jgi:hypothetical protein
MLHSTCIDSYALVLILLIGNQHLVSSKVTFHITLFDKRIPLLLYQGSITFYSFLYLFILFCISICDIFIGTGYISLYTLFCSICCYILLELTTPINILISKSFCICIRIVILSCFCIVQNSYTHLLSNISFCFSISDILIGTDYIHLITQYSYPFFCISVR